MTTRLTVAAARRPSCLPHRRRCVAEPVHASTTSNRSASTPSLLHVTRSGLSAMNAGSYAVPLSQAFILPTSPTPKAPSLHRHYPASAVIQAPPPPCRPGLPLAGFRLVRAHHRQGFPCCHRPPLPCVPPSLPRRSQPVRASLASRPVAACPVIRRVGLRVARCEACSTFTRVAARMVAEPPRAARCIEVHQPKSLPPSTAPIATGWSDSCRAGFAPAR